MKILHTSDIHLGKKLLGYSLIEEQEYILNNLINVIKENKVELLIIAGDIYDRAIPPVEAVNLFDNFLNSIINDIKVPILIVSGNHDSPDRLEYGSKLFESVDLYIESKPKKDMKVISINEVNFYMLPFITKAEISNFFDIDFEDYNSALLYYIEYNLKNFDKSKTNILIHHGMIIGGESSDSEKNIVIGGADSVNKDVFKDFDYVALGHLHKKQRLDKNIIYSGSILKYSFSECNNNKSYILFDSNDMDDIKEIPIIPKTEMIIIEDFYENIMKMDDSKAFTKIILKDKEQVYDPFINLKSKFPNLMSLEYNDLFSESEDIEYIQNIEDLNVKELFNIFYESEKGEKPSQEKEKYFDQILNKLEIKERGV